MVALNHQRFSVFCQQRDLNPRSSKFAIITGTRDMHKIRGCVEFDVVYLTDYADIPFFGAIESEIRMRQAHPLYKGNTYFFIT